MKFTIGNCNQKTIKQSNFKKRKTTNKQKNNYTNKSTILTQWQVTYPKLTTGTPKQNVK